MSDPWLTILGLGDDGAMGLTNASREWLDQAEIVIGGPRHLAHVAGLTAGKLMPWPVPFDIAPVLAHRGRRVVVLASGDPFFFGAGGSLMAHLAAGEWRSIPHPSSFSLVANLLGWPMETTICHGLHAAPLARMRADLAQDARVICTLRDANAPKNLADYLTNLGFGASVLHICENMGGTDQRHRVTRADAFDLGDIAPLCIAAILVRGSGLPRSSGMPDDLFINDGQITKRPIRALTLSALAPREGEVLWDIGAGSGSISVEWCLAGGISHAVETKQTRVHSITQNAANFGVDHRLNVHLATAPDGLISLPCPHAVFIGGGGNAALYDALWPLMPDGTRLIANAVTLETESLLVTLQARFGGNLLKIDLATATPLGSMLGWTASRPVVQWSVIK
jgi:precorrin-6B C5,15-methyltransferase / cobalt-precorrin-6B C5,C15-methyltransferase